MQGYCSRTLLYTIPDYVFNDNVKTCHFRKHLLHLYISKVRWHLKFPNFPRQKDFEAGAFLKKKRILEILNSKMSEFGDSDSVHSGDSSVLLCIGTPLLGSLTNLDGFGKIRGGCTNPVHNCSCYVRFEHQLSYACLNCQGLCPAFSHVSWNGKFFFFFFSFLFLTFAINKKNPTSLLSTLKLDSRPDAHSVCEKK